MNHRIINRYLIREIAGIFALGLTIFTLVLLMGRMVKLMEMVVSNGVPAAQVLLLIVQLLPSFLVLTIPMALLLAVLLAVGRLSGDNEIIVLQASGVSLSSLLPPVMLMSLLAALATLVISVYGVPWGNSGFRQLTVDIARKYAASAVQERVFRDDLPGVVLYVEHFDEAQHTMQQVMIQDSRDQQRPLTIFARSGMLLSDDGAGALRIILRDGSIHTRQQDDYRLATFSDYHLTVNTGRAASAAFKARDLAVRELLQQSAAATTPPEERARLLLELHRRFAFPGAAVVFGLVALPLGLHNRRSGKGAGFTVSILVLLVYYVLQSFLEVVAEKGVLAPALAAWLPNMLFLGVGLALFRAALQERPLLRLFPLAGRGTQ